MMPLEALDASCGVHVKDNLRNGRSGKACSFMVISVAEFRIHFTISNMALVDTT
jgi:hypothetical protein